MRPPGLVAWVKAEARYLRAVLCQAGYWVRPYDMLADRRHWRWQRPAPCGRVALASLTPQQLTDLEAAVHAAVRERTGRGEDRTGW